MGMGSPMLGNLDDRQFLSTLGPLTLLRRWRMISVCILLSLLLGIAWLYSKGTNYTASVQFLVYVREVQPGSEFVISLGRADLIQVENEIEIIRSRGTLAKVVRALNLAEDPEFVPPVTRLDDIKQWLFAVPQAAPDQSHDKQEVAVESLAKLIVIKKVGTSHTILVNVTTTSPEKSARIANGISQIMLQARVSAEQDGDRSSLLRERLQGLGPSVYIMTPALVPAQANGPRKVLVVLASLVAGALLGAMLALLLELSDRTIRTAAQLERLDLECIGAIPQLNGEKPMAPTPTRAGEAEAEWRGTLPDRTLNQTLVRMMVAAETAKARIVGVASPTAGEGATTMARHLAQMAARSHRKVLLVEMAPRRALRVPAENVRFLRHDNDGGPDILAIAASGSGDDRLDWWTHCDPAALAAYNLIVVGLPPLEQGPAFRLAAQNIHGVLLVVKWGGADVERIERALAGSGAAPADFIGAVLNRVDGRMIGRFGDKLWKAEACVAARQRLFAATMPIAAGAGS